MTAYLICTLVALGVIALLDALMLYGADPKKPGQMHAVGVVLLHAVPLVMAIIAVALELGR